MLYVLQAIVFFSSLPQTKNMYEVGTLLPIAFCLFLYCSHLTCEPSYANDLWDLVERFTTFIVKAGTRVFAKYFKAAVDAVWDATQRWFRTWSAGGGTPPSDDIERGWRRRGSWRRR